MGLRLSEQKVPGSITYVSRQRNSVPSGTPAINCAIHSRGFVRGGLHPWLLHATAPQFLHALVGTPRGHCQARGA